MKSVLISIQPKWCELIASGKKTVEVRKTRPRLETPFKCYIYMTAGDAIYPVTINGAPYTCSNVGGKCVIGEFVCDEIYKIDKDSVDFIYKTETEHTYFEFAKGVYGFNTCLTEKELLDYLNYKHGYGWHISNLVIYEKPKELSEFFIYCGDNPTKCERCEAHYYSNTECGKEDYCCSVIEGHRPLKRPPRSWCYAEKRGEADA